MDFLQSYTLFFAEYLHQNHRLSLRSSARLATPHNLHGWAQLATLHPTEVLTIVQNAALLLSVDVHHATIQDTDPGQR